MSKYILIFCFVFSCVFSSAFAQSGNNITVTGCSTQLSQVKSTDGSLFTTMLCQSGNEIKYPAFQCKPQLAKMISLSGEMVFTRKVYFVNASGGRCDADPNIYYQCKWGKKQSEVWPGEDWKEVHNLMAPSVLQCPS